MKNLRTSTDNHNDGPEPENSPGECRDSERPDLAAYAAAHELGFSRAEQARDLIAGLLHGLEEARHGAGGCRQ